jgi:hypothetical protein
LKLSDAADLSEIAYVSFRSVGLSFSNSGTLP